MSLKNDPLVLDVRRTVRYFRRITSMYEARQPPYDRLKLPEHQALGGLDPVTRDYRLALFFACWMSRSGNHSSEVYALAAQTLAERPWLVDPALSSDHAAHAGELADIIPGMHSRREGQVNAWVRCMEMLRDEYGSDPLNIFVGLPVRAGWRTARAELRDRLTAFPYIGPKITGLVVGTFQQEALPKGAYWDRVRCLPFYAADRHTMRLIYMHGLVKEWHNDHMYQLGPFLSEQLADILYRNGIDPAQAFRAEWLIGSAICDVFRTKPAGEGRAHCRAVCPAYAECRGLVPVNVVPGEGKRKKYLTVIRYADMVPHADR